MTSGNAAALLRFGYHFRATPGTPILNRDFTVARVHRLVAIYFDDGEEEIVTKLRLIAAIKEGKVTHEPVQSVAIERVREVLRATSVGFNYVEVQHRPNLHGLQERRAPRPKLWEG